MFNKYFIIFIFFSYSFLANAQKHSSLNKKDTIFIYDTVVVYDTIFFYDTIKIGKNLKIENQGDFNLNPLNSSKISEKDTLLIVLAKKTATIPMSSIILNENIQNLENMKKVNFLGLMLFAFQGVVMTQTRFGISSGVGTWWAKCNEPITNAQFSPTFNVGSFLEYPLNKNFFLRTELNYHLLASNYGYKAVLDSINGVIVGEKESVCNYQQFSLGLKIGSKIGRIKPFLGIEQSCRISTLDSFKNKLTPFGFTAGFNYEISDKMLLELNYYNGLTKDYRRDLLVGPTRVYHNYQEEVISNFLFWKSDRLELKLCYIFNSKRNQQNKIDKNKFPD